MTKWCIKDRVYKCMYNCAYRQTHTEFSPATKLDIIFYSLGLSLGILQFITQNLWYQYTYKQGILTFGITQSL